MSTLRRLVRALLDLVSPRPLPEVGRHGSADLLTEGNFDSVEAWLRAEIDAWDYAASHSRDPVKRVTFHETANFYAQRLQEHLERRSGDHD